MTRRATTFPSLGNPKDIDRLAPAVKQILENWMGNTGDGLDKVLTLQDLADVGLITVRTVGGKTRLSGLTPGVLPGGSADSYVFATPSAPTGLAASGALGGVNLSWDASSDAYYAYTEILRAATNDAGVAVVVGKSIFNVYRDELWSGASNYYWVRFVNSDGATVKTGPLNSANGTLGEVGVDPAYVLSVLQSQITESQLYGTLNTRINLIDTPTTGLIDRMTSTESATTTNATDITALETTVNDGTSGVAANAAAVTALDSRVTTAEGNITASAADITALETTVNNPTTGVSANASAVSALETTVNDGTSGVAANASAITTLQSTVGNNTTAISTEASTRATADGLLNAEYTIKADVNGHVAGMGVAVSGGASGPITSEIIMLADKFAIGLPAATWTAAQAFTLGQYAKPTVANGFIYKCTTAGTTGGTEPTWPTTLALTVADGTVVWTCVSITSTVPFIVGSVGGNPAVVMDTAIIADASIGNAKIGDLAADKITTGDLTATLTINGGAIYGGVVATSSGTGYRAGMSGVDSYPFWAGTGTKNDANAIFFVKNDGTAKFSGTVTFGSSSSGYANISDKPTSLSGINGTEGTKLSGIADGADVTSANTAAAIAGQGALATASTADWSTQVAGTGKPANNADVTSANTSADTSAVNGVAASTVQSYASTAGAWRHASDTTKIDGGDIYTNTVTANAIAANAITADKILAGAVTATKISVTSLSSVSAALGTITSGTIQTARLLTAASGKRIDLNPSNDNELHFYGDRGDGTVEELASIGIKTVGADNYVGIFGSAQSGSDRIGLLGQSYSSYGVSGYSYSNNGVYGYSALGRAVYAYAPSSEAVYAVSHASYGAYGYSLVDAGVCAQTGGTTLGAFKIIAKANTTDPTTGGIGQFSVLSDGTLRYDNGTAFETLNNSDAVAGAVGTYAFAKRTTGTTDIAFGSTLAGSSLKPTSAFSASDSYGVAFLGMATGAVLAGTWQAMGTYDYSDTYGDGESYGATLWLRIS